MTLTIPPKWFGLKFVTWLLKLAESMAFFFLIPLNTPAMVHSKIKQHMCQGLNSHYFHNIIGDGKINPLVGERWDDHPQYSDFWPWHIWSFWNDFVFFAEKYFGLSYFKKCAMPIFGLYNMLWGFLRKTPGKMWFFGCSLILGVFWWLVSA